MHLPLVLALLLCGSSAGPSDGLLIVPDEALFRTDERFELTCRGVTGTKIDVRGEVFPGRRSYLTCVTPEGDNVLLDILLQKDGQGKWRLNVRLLEYPRNGPARNSSISQSLAPGESWIGGQGWNSLVEIRLAQK
jgi:hypothetical protein